MRAYDAIRIETPRLVLRPLRLDDAEVLLPMYADAETMRYMGVDAYGGTAADLRATLEMRLEVYRRDGFGLLATELRDTGEFIGRCGHLRWNVGGTVETEVGYLISRAHWGKGYATEAARALLYDGFAHLDVWRLISLIHPLNVASQRVALHNGLRYEGEVTIPEIPVRPVFPAQWDPKLGIHVT